MDYTGKSLKQWIILATAQTMDYTETSQSNGLYWQQLKTMDYTGNSSKQWIILATAQNNGVYWQQLKTIDYTGNISKQWIILATAQNNGFPKQIIHNLHKKLKNKQQR